jgi:hypothetical protein
MEEKMVSNVRLSMGVCISIGLALSAVMLMWMTASPAQAQSVDECEPDIAALRVQTENATFIGQSAANAAKDKAGLIGKLDSASAKLRQDKFQGASVNLESFRTKVEDLDQQGKISHEDALVLIAGADEAIGCVQGLVESQATPAA